MVVVPESPCRNREGNAVRNNLLVVSVKFVIPPPNLILTAFSAICISLLFFIVFFYQQHIVPLIRCQRPRQLIGFSERAVLRRDFVPLALHRNHLHRRSAIRGGFVVVGEDGVGGVAPARLAVGPARVHGLKGGHYLHRFLPLRLLKSRLSFR